MPTKKRSRKKEKMEMIYTDSENQVTHGFIKVHVVTEMAIKSYCYSKRQFRTFKLYKILFVVPLHQRREA